MSIKHWTISPQLITQEAKKIGYKVDILSKSKNLYAIHKDNKIFFFKSSSMMEDSFVGTKITENKDLFFDVVEKYMPEFPKPKSINLKKGENIEVKLQEKKINYPLVIKPTNGAHGDDVIIDIKNEKQLKVSLNNLFKKYNDIIVQEMLVGDDYRILVIGNKVKAVTKRIPAFVVGDGEKNIKELVDIENQNPLRCGKDHTGQLSQIFIDEETNRLLESFNMNIYSVINKNERVFLKRTANISTGGFGIDFTDEISVKTVQLAEKLSKLLKMSLLGIDIIANDISKPLGCGEGLIEANSCPGLRMHHFPYEGEARNVAREILKSLK